MFVGRTLFPRENVFFFRRLRWRSLILKLLDLFALGQILSLLCVLLIGASGGILLVWNVAYWQKLDEFVGRFSVSVLLKDVRCHMEWVATSVYGPSSSSDRVEFGTELSQVARLWKRPWVVGSDFNCIRFPSEKKRGSVITSAMRDFSDWIRSNDLVDLPLRAADFTWSNMQREPIISRLDWFLVSSE